MIVKNKLHPVEQIRQILKNQHGTLLTSDLAMFHIPRTYLSILERNGEIVRVSRGVYRAAAAIEDEMLSFQAIYKSSIYSHETALFLHDLTDRTPLAYSVTVPIGYHSTSLIKSKHKVFYLNRVLFDMGVISMKSPHGNPIRVTSLERTICDILRSRNKADIEQVYQALKRYVSKQERDIDLLYNYAIHFRIQKIAREYIDVLL